MNRVLIVILNWNGLEDTLKCVDSILNQSYKNFTICIVDNNSDVRPSTKIKPDNNIVLIDNPTNLGFAEGVNTGIRYALENNYEYVALVNNDALADKDWLENLVSSSQQNNSSITAGVVLNESGTFIDSCGEYFSSWGVSFPAYRMKAKTEIPESGRVFGATGGGVLYKTSLFKDIGLFDARFFMYFEDADINFRSQLNGHSSYYTRSAVLYHKGGASSNKVKGLTVYHTFKNLPLVFWKNTPTRLLIRVGIRFLLLYTLIFGNAIKNGTGVPAFKGFLASIYHFWTSALWKRLKIQKSKKVSADHIWSILYHDLPPEQTGMRKFRKLFTGKA